MAEFILKALVKSRGLQDSFYIESAAVSDEEYGNPIYPHETNLKKQGVLALTFSDPADYARVRQDDRISVACSALKPGEPVAVLLQHADGTEEGFQVRHSYNDQQIGWLRAGSALNALSAGRNGF